MKRAIVIALSVVAVTWPTGAAADRRVVRDDRVTAVYALHGTVLYQRHSPGGQRQWKRVAAGTVSRAEGVPKGADVGSIGIDRAGNVVATLKIGQIYAVDPRWWVYDIARDVARPVVRLAPRGCAIGALALWRSRIAYAQRCDRPGVDGMMLRTGRRTQRVGSVDDADLFAVLHDRSLVTVGNIEEAWYVRPVLSRGTKCEDIIFNGDADEAWHALSGVSIGTAGAEWVMASDLSVLGVGGGYTNLAVVSVDLNGHCAALGTQRPLAVSPPGSAVHAAAIDGRWLYYASDTGIYRQRLAAHGSTAPPANDDVEHALRIGPDLPASITGTVGYATRQPGEPGDSWIRRTVWYAWRPAASMTVTASTGFLTGHAIDVFTGDTPATLTPVTPVTPVATNYCGPWSFDATAGQTYRIRVSSGMQPSFAPFKLTITEGLTAIQC